MIVAREADVTESGDNAARYEKEGSGLGQMLPVLLTGLAFVYYLMQQPVGARSTPGGVATAACKSALLWVKIVGALLVLVVAIFAGTRVR